MGLRCVGNETKPKGEVWKWFKKVPAEKHGGPLGLQCLGAGCPRIYFQAIPNATKLARHAAACCALPQAALEDRDSEGPILIELIVSYRFGTNAREQEDEPLSADLAAPQVSRQKIDPLPPPPPRHPKARDADVRASVAPPPPDALRDDVRASVALPLPAARPPSRSAHAPASAHEARLADELQRDNERLSESLGAAYERLQAAQDSWDAERVKFKADAADARTEADLANAAIASAGIKPRGPRSGVASKLQAELRLQARVDDLEADLELTRKAAGDAQRTANAQFAQLERDLDAARIAQRPAQSGDAWPAASPAASAASPAGPASVDGDDSAVEVSALRAQLAWYAQNERLVVEQLARVEQQQRRIAELEAQVRALEAAQCSALEGARRGPDAAAGGDGARLESLRVEMDREREMRLRGEASAEPARRLLEVEVRSARAAAADSRAEADDAARRSKAAAADADALRLELWQRPAAGDADRANRAAEAAEEKLRYAVAHLDAMRSAAKLAAHDAAAARRQLALAAPTTPTDVAVTALAARVDALERNAVAAAPPAPNKGKTGTQTRITRLPL
ncbi:hypothetical protein M885DRAFT_624835 [Pelagophyceae sp. CCMP2097]|nr:hypothetical protein M885DRAFT_624835 [Pelagophyceae sp. CCMP2097]